MALFKCDIFSNVLEMATTLNVIIPEQITNKDTAKVVYLLHGLSDNATNWQRLTRVELYAREMGIVVVIPEVQRSFYTDMEFGMNYFTYISDELPKIIEQFFGFLNKRENKYVMGLSMGGYGALKIGLACPDKFYGIGAFSSCCDMSYEARIKRISNVKEYIGLLGNALKVKPQDDLFHLATVCNKKPIKPKIFMTCGTEDFLYEQNIAMRDHMKALDYEYTYEEWTGEHSWDFWDISVLKAFKHFFS